MIAFVRGSLVEQAGDRAVVDVAGVGYDVLMSLTGLGGLPAAGSEVMIYTHTHVREDVFQLYGFLESVEREAFRMLINISGIGPKLAIQILGGISIPELVVAVQSKDLARLNSLSGVGKKTAERLLIDLRDKISTLDASGLVGDMSVFIEGSPGGALFRDLRSALVNLGYKVGVVDRALENMNDGQEREDFQAALREALTHLS